MLIRKINKWAVKFMNFMKFNIEKTELSANLIPLINVIFVVLIFFLVLYRFSTIDTNEDTSNDEKEEDSEIDITGGMNNVLEMKNTIIIEISESNKIFVNGSHTGNNLPAIKEIIINPEETRCILRIDKDATYRSIGTLIRNLKRLGVSKISFKTVS